MQHDERRRYPREDVVAAMICALDGLSVSTHCVVKNVSLDGALFQCPLAGQDESVFEIGEGVTVWDILDGDSSLMHGNEGEVAWIYKRFIGVHFPQFLMESPEALRTWLEDHHLV